MSLKITFPKILILAIFFLILNIVTISLGEDDESSLTVVNKTKHYLHVFIDGEPYLYVSPNRSATHTTSAKPTMIVDVFYSPGQGVTGSVRDTVDVPYWGSEECLLTCTYIPPSGGSARWEVMPEDLQSE